MSELDATLSQISHTVLRARDREKLLVEVCQIAVRFGCFKLAWIAWLDPSSNVLVTVAKAGDEAGLVTSEFVRRFCGGLSAIQSAQPFVVDELSASRCASGCRDIAEQLGVRSFATYPIRVQNDVCGVLTVCKAAPCSLDDNEAHLLEELTLDLSFALNNFEIERQCREAERGLKHAQQRLQTVLEQALDGFYLIDTHGKLLEVNDAYCLMSGYTREELLQMHVSELESTENEQEVAAHIQRVISQGMDRFETSHRRKDGQVINIETSVKFQSFDGGRFFCFLRDITERKRAEQALRESEDRFRRVVEGAPVGILIQSGGVDRYVNPAGLAMFGEKTADQIVGHTVLERIHPEHRAAVKERLQILQEERRAVPFLEEKLLRPDGKAFDAEVSAVPFTFEGAQGSVVFVRDITERKQEEQALRRSEEKYRQLFENATYGIFRSKPDGTLLDVNSALVAMLGYDSKEQLLSLKLNSDVYENPADRAAAIEKCMPTGRVGGVEVKWKRRDGNIIHVRLTGRIIGGGDGKIGDMEVIVEDITERLGLEEQLRQSQKMEAVGLLAGGIAHDFNNLLSVILGNSELLLDTAQAGPASHYAHEIKKATRRAAELTRQLLAFSRKQVLHPAILDLNAVIQDVGKILQRVIGEDVRIVTDLATNLGSIRADRGQIEQILMNLATNARDAMPNGGKFTLRTGNIDLGPEDAARHSWVKVGQYIHLAVSDTGMGMTEDVRSRVFEPFFTTKGRGRGTGLGLATAYGIVKQSAGFIWVSSAPGAGTTFDIYFPRLEEKAARLVSDLEVRSEYPRGTETILLLEDEEALRQVTCEFLTASGYTVLQAARSEHAIEVASKHKGSISLIVSDIVLPDRNGPSTVAKMQGLHPEAKVLYVSGYTEVPVAQQLVAEGATLLQKPVSRSDLLRKVDEMLHIRPDPS